MKLKIVSGARRGNLSKWDARNWVQDPDHISPRLKAWLIENPGEVANFKWTRPPEWVELNAKSLRVSRREKTGV